MLFSPALLESSPDTYFASAQCAIFQLILPDSAALDVAPSEVYAAIDTEFKTRHSALGLRCSNNNAIEPDVMII